MAKFKKFPKLELHAHLNGSLSEETIKKLLTTVHDGHASDGNKFKVDQTNFKDLNSCFEVFKIAHNATKTEEAVRLATMWTIEEFKKDGVVYLELRSTPRNEDSMTKEMYLTAIIDAIVEARSTIPSIFVTLLVSVNRSEGVEEANENIELAMKLMKSHPSIIVGVDFSGNPAIGQFTNFVPILQRARENGLKLTLHCGEVKNDEEVDEMLDFGADRLGHVTCLTAIHHQKLKNLKIPVELCLSSNVMCGTVSNFGSHHLKDISNIDIPFILATDDKGVFDTTLSKEYQIAHETFGITVEALWEMNNNAVNFIFAPDIVREKIRSTLREWKRVHLKF